MRVANVHGGLKRALSQVALLVHLLVLIVLKHARQCQLLLLVVHLVLVFLGPSEVRARALLLGHCHVARVRVFQLLRVALETGIRDYLVATSGSCSTVVVFFVGEELRGRSSGGISTINRLLRLLRGNHSRLHLVDRS